MRPIPTRQSRCYFGIAVGDMTPPVGIYHRMWGAAEHDRSEGVHRPLTATAMSFQAIDSNPTSRQVLVALDLCLLGVDELDILLRRAARVIDRDLITVTFSHTHAAGLLNLDRQDLSGGELIPPYLDDLADTVTDLIAAATESAREVDIVYGEGRCNLAAHRDLFDAEQNEYVCGFDPQTCADDTILVARVTEPAGTCVAAIVNYACHPTTLAWENRLISPDFPGAMRETVSTAINAPCVFLQGASGELGPVEGFVGDPRIADRNGRQLAFAALSTLESLPPPGTTFEFTGKVVSGATIGTWSRKPTSASRAAALTAWGVNRKEIELRYRNDLRRSADVAARLAELTNLEAAARRNGQQDRAADLRALAERERRSLGRLRGMVRDDCFPLQTAVWRIGDAIWIAIQGEPYSLLQRRLRETFADNPIVVAAISNGWGPSYLPPREAYGKGIYQESVSWLAAGSLETVIDSLSDRIRTLLSE